MVSIAASPIMRAKQIFAIRMQPSFHLDFHSVVFTLLLTTTFSRPVDPAFIV